MKSKLKIAIFASGAGSNALKIIQYFENNIHIKIDLIVSNNSNAYVLEIAKLYNIKAIVIKKINLINDELVNTLNINNINLVVLAGFLLQLPPNFIHIFNGKIINIHPSLLPKYGGKGMYGMNVHQAVKDAKDTKTGITIHYVNENYDEGEIILQKDVKVDLSDTIENIANKVHQLEYLYFAPTIEKLCLEM